MSIKTSLLILSLLSSTLWVTVASANFSSEQSIQPQTITLKLQNMTCALCPITPLSQNSCRLKFLKIIKFEIRDANKYKVF